MTFWRHVFSCFFTVCACLLCTSCIMPGRLVRAFSMLCIAVNNKVVTFITDVVHQLKALVLETKHQQEYRGLKTSLTYLIALILGAFEPQFVHVDQPVADGVPYKSVCIESFSLVTRTSNRRRRHENIANIPHLLYDFAKKFQTQFSA